MDTISIFYTDRSNGFKNQLSDELLAAFNIIRSLSKKGCSCDNAVAEAGFQVIKKEFAFNRTFTGQEELDLGLFIM